MYLFSKRIMCTADLCEFLYVSGTAIMLKVSDLVTC